MNSSSMQTNLVLDGFFALLACGKCKQTPEKPVRFITCGHFFCNTCAENDTVCRQCNTPVEPCEKRPYHTVAQLINYCKTMKEMITDLDVGDLWPLANAIHRFTDEPSELAETTELHSEKVTEPVQPDERLNEINSESESVGYIEPTQCQRPKRSDVNVENSSILNSSAHGRKCNESDLQLSNSKPNSRTLNESNVHPENESFVNSKEIRKTREERHSQLKNGSFASSKGIRKSREENYLQPGNEGFVKSKEIRKSREENCLQPQNESFINSKEIRKSREENHLQPENGSFINSKENGKSREEHHLQPENRSFINSSQPDRIRNENDVWPENVSFVHSTQIIKARGNGEAESETPGFIDPTQISPIHKDVDFESETPGYRDPTQAVRQPEESNFDPETPGYRDSTQISQRRRERFTNDETVGYIDPTPVNRSRRSSEPEPNTVPETEPASTTNWQDDMELEIADKDLFSPIPESSPDDTLAPETVEMEVSFCEGDIIPETLEVDRPIVSKAVDSPRKSDEVADGTLARQRMRTLHRKTYPMSDYDVRIAAEPASKTSTRLHRRLTDSEFDSRTTNSIGNFDTLSVPDVRDPFMENLHGNEEAPAHQSRRLESSSLNKRRNRLLINDHDAFGAVEAPSKQLRRIRDSKLDRQREILINPRESLSSAESRDFIETDRIRKSGREFCQMADDTMSTDSVRDSPMETVEMVEKTQPRLQRRMRDDTCDVGAVSISNTSDTSKRDAEVEKKKPVKHLRRLSSWEIELRKRNLNNRDAMEIPLAASDPVNKKEAPMKQLGRVEDPKLVRPNETPNDSRHRLVIADLRNSDTEPEETVDVTSANHLARIKNLAMDRMNKDSLSDRDTLLFANGAHLAETTDFETECIQFGDDYSPIKRRSKTPTADYDTAKTTRVGESSMQNSENPEREPPRQLGRLTNWPLNRHNVESMNDSDTVDVTDVGDLETEKNREERPLRRLKRLQNPKPTNHSMMPSDLHGVDITNIQDFDRERLLNEPPTNDSDMVDVGDLNTEKNREVRPLRHLKRLQNPKPANHSMMPSDLHGVDITNIQDFDRERLLNEPQTNDSDMVDVGELNTEKNREVRPLRHLKRLQNPKPANHSMMPSDLHGVDITNIQDFDRERLLNEPPTNDSDTVDVNVVRDLLTESEQIPEARPLRQLKRLQTPKPVHHSIIPSDLRGVDITNIEDFAKDRATLTKNALTRGENSMIKRPSKIPTNVRNLLPAATAAVSATETSGQAPLKQLRSVENLENLETHDKIPAKKAKAKIVQLKPRRRTIDKSTAVPKTMPKNVNKRNAKGETLLHTACVKGQNDYVKSLLEAGANPNTKDNASWTPLQEVVKLGRREICEMLLQFGASPNTPGIENRTALHDASQNDKLAEAALLLRFNASRNVYDKYGKRPIDYAVSDEMRALLSKENAVDRIAGEAACLNATLDQSIPTPNAKVVVLPSNLSSANKKALSHVASKLKVAVATTFRPGVTHIVVEANERNTTELSHNVILAILQGIWILNSQWIAISMDLNDISEIDLELFEVHGAPYPGTPERSRMNEEKQNPRLFNNCSFYFTIGVRGTWSYGNLEFTKVSLTTLVLAGQGEVLKREPDPEDVKDNAVIPFHVANKPIHPLHRCSHYIIYMPGKDEPRIKYNMPHIKTLPLAWLLECIEKFALVDPILIGIS